MKKMVLSAIVAVGLITMSGCSQLTSDIEVTSKTSSKVNLDGYKTFAWLPVTNVLVDENEKYKGRGYSVNDFMHSKINKELLNEHKTETTSSPDFLITYVVGANMDAVKEKVDEKGKEYLQNIPKAAIAVVAIDTKTLEIIWAASAEAGIKKDISDEESKERLSYAIKKMFSEF